MKTVSNFLRLMIVPAMISLLFACKKNSVNINTDNNTPVTVSIADMAFSPAAVDITTNMTVTWTNNDSETHTVTADDGSFDSGDIAPGSSFSRTFTTSGTFAYHCTLHPTMTGSVAVAAK